MEKDQEALRKKEAKSQKLASKYEKSKKEGNENIRKFEDDGKKKPELKVNKEEEIA